MTQLSRHCTHNGWRSRSAASSSFSLFLLSSLSLLLSLLSLQAGVASAQTPRIDSLSPQFGSNDTRVTIFGANFATEYTYTWEGWFLHEDSTQTLPAAHGEWTSVFGGFSPTSIVVQVGSGLPVGMFARVSLRPLGQPLGTIITTAPLSASWTVVPPYFTSPLSPTGSNTVQISAIGFVGDGITDSVVTFTHANGGSVQPSTLAQSSVLQIGFFKNASAPLTDEATGAAAATAHAAFTPCTLLSYVDHMTFNCTIRFPTAGKYLPGLSFTGPAPTGGGVTVAGAFVRMAKNAATQSSLLTTAYPIFSSVYSSISPTSFPASMYEWAADLSREPFANAPRTFRMVLPLNNNIMAPAVQGRALVFRFMAPSDVPNSGWGGFQPNTYFLSRVSVGLRSGGNAFAAGVTSGATSMIPTAFASSMTPLTFKGAAWTTEVPVSGIAYLDSDPVDISAWCVPGITDGGLPFDLVLSVTRRNTYIAPDLQLRGVATMTPALSWYAGGTTNLDAQAADPLFATVGTGNGGTASIASNTRAAVALHSVWVTQQPSVATTSNACKPPRIRALVVSEPAFASVMPRYLFPNTRVTITGRYFTADMRVNYTIAPNPSPLFGTSTPAPAMYSTLQFTNPSVCSNASLSYCDVLQNCFLQCNIGNDIPVNHTAYFIVYSTTQGTLISGPSPAGATIYPDMLSGMIAARQTAWSGSSVVTVIVQLNTAVANAYSWRYFEFSLYYITPDGQSLPCSGYINPATDNPPMWSDFATSKLLCTINVVQTGTYTFKAWHGFNDITMGVAEGVQFFSSTGSGPLSTVQMFPVHNELFDGSAGGVNPILATYYSDQLTAASPTGLFPPTPPRQAGAGTLRFAIQLGNLDVVESGVTTTSVILRLRHATTTPYTVQSVSVSLGFADDPSFIAASELLVSWRGNTSGPANPAANVTVPQGLSMTSWPIPLCLLSSSNGGFDLIVSMRITPLLSPVMPMWHGVGVPYTSKAFWWPDLEVVGNTFGVAGSAVRQPNWAVYDGTVTRSSQWLDPSGLLNTPLVALSGITALNDASCGAWPNITGVSVAGLQSIAPFVSFTVTITGINFLGSAGGVPLVFYDATSNATAAMRGSAFSSPCTGVVVQNDNQLTCMLGMDVRSDMRVGFLIVKQTSGGGVMMSTLPAVPSPAVLLASSVNLLEGIRVSPMSGVVGVTVTSVIITTLTTQGQFAAAQTGVAGITIGYVNPSTGVSTQCGPASVWMDSTHFVCSNFLPANAGAYVFVAFMQSGIHALSLASTGGAFTAYSVFTSMFDVATTYSGGSWDYDADTAVTGDVGLTHRTVLPFSTFTSSGGGLVLRMRTGDGPVSFDRVTLSVGRIVPLNKSMNAFASYLMPVLFYGAGANATISVPANSTFDSDPLPFCVQTNLGSQLDLVFTFHRTGRSWNWLAGTTRTPDTYSIPDSSLPVGSVAPSRSSQWNLYSNLRFDDSIYGLSSIYTTNMTSQTGSGSFACLQPVISSVLLGTTLPGQGLIVTLSGTGFNTMSAAALEKTRNSLGFLTAVQLSYIVLASNNTAGTIQSVDTGASFTLGNATLCTNLQVLSPTALTCTLSALTVVNVGQRLQLQLFQQGQLSAVFPWTITLPPFVDALAGVVASPQNGRTIVSAEPFRAVVVTLTLPTPPLLTTSQILASGALGYTSPAAPNVFVPCLNLTAVDSLHFTCGILPTAQGKYAFQLAFFNGYNSTTLSSPHGSFSAFSSFALEYSNAAAYLTNPAMATRNYGASAKILLQSSTAYRFTISKSSFFNASSIALRMLGGAATLGASGYSFNYVSIGYGLAGQSDVYPNSIVPVYFNGAVHTSNATLNALNWAAPRFVEKDSFMDSSPIPFCMIPPVNSTTARPFSGTWDIIVTVHLVGSTVNVPIVAAAALTAPYPTFVVTDLKQWSGGNAATTPVWSDLARQFPASPPVDTQLMWSTMGIDSIMALSNATCSMPVIRTIYPLIGPARTSTTITLIGSGFLLPGGGVDSLPSTNNNGWLVTYGIRNATYLNTLLPASTSSCTNVRVLSNSQLTCQTGTDIFVNQSAEFLLSNSLIGTIARSYFTPVTDDVFTAKPALLTGIQISPQSVLEQIANQHVTVYLPHGVTKASFKNSVASYKIGFVYFDAVTAAPTFTGCGDATSPDTVTWTPLAGHTAADCMDCSAFTCSVGLLSASNGPYFIQARMIGNLTSDVIDASTASSNYEITSNVTDSSSQFFVVYKDRHNLAAVTGFLLLPGTQKQGWINDATTGTPGYTPLSVGVNPGVSPVLNSFVNGGASYRFAIPITTAGFTQLSSAIVIRMSSQPYAYNFSGMTIGLGSPIAHNSSIDMFANTVQTVSFGGRLNYTTGPMGARAIDQVVSVPANTSVESNPVFFCTYPATQLLSYPYQHQTWSLIVTLHGFRGTPLPALHVNASVPKGQQTYLFQDTASTVGYNASTWSTSFQAGSSSLVFEAPKLASVGIDQIFSVDATRIPTYYTNAWPLPSNGAAACSNFPIISSVLPAFVFPRTPTTITLVGTDFVSGVTVFYGLFGGFGPVPANTTTAPTAFLQNACTNVQVLSSVQLTCVVGSNIMRGQRVQFLVVNRWTVSNPSQFLPTQIDFILAEIQGANGNAIVSPLLPNPFPIAPAFDALQGQVLTRDVTPLYTITVPYVLTTLLLRVRTQLFNSTSFWQIGPGTNITRALASNPAQPLWQPLVGNVTNSTLCTPNCWASGTVVNLAVGLNFLQVWNRVDNLVYNVQVNRSVPDVQSITLLPDPLSSSMASPSLPTSFVSSTRAYTMRVPFLTRTFEAVVVFNTPWTVLIDYAYLVPTLLAGNGSSNATAVNGTAAVNATAINATATWVHDVANVTADIELFGYLPYYEFDLAVGSSLLIVNSTLDGNYVWNVTRNPPDTKSVSVIAHDQYGVARTLDPQLSPAFNSLNVDIEGSDGFYPVNHSVSVFYVQQSVSFRVGFNTAGTVSVSKLVNASDPIGRDWPLAAYLQYALPSPVSSSVESQTFNLTVGSNVFFVNSSLDGIYVFVVVRAAPIMREVIFYANALMSTGFGFTIPLIPGVYRDPTYSSTYPRDIGGNFQVGPLTFDDNAMQTLGANNSIYARLNGDNSAIQPPVPSDVAGNYFGSGYAFTFVPVLHIGQNLLEIITLYDGTYYFPILRKASDINEFRLIGISPTSYPSREINTTLSPRFTPGPALNRSYTATFPFAAWQLEVVTFTDAANPTIVDLTHYNASTGLPVGNTVTVANLASGQRTPPFTLQVGLSVVRLSSEIEGFYYFNITRLPPDISEIRINHPEAQINLNYAVEPIQLFSSFNYKYNYSVWFGSEFVNPLMLWATPGTVQLALNGTNIQTPPYNADQQGNTLIGINSYQLLQGVNVLTISSVLDGQYTFILIRRDPDLVSLRVRLHEANGSLFEWPLVPAFVPGVRLYDLSCSFRYTGLQFLLNATNSLALDINSPLLSSGYTEWKGSVPTYTWTDTLPVAAQTSLTSTFDFTVLSTNVDRNYVIRVRRAAHNVQRIVMFADKGSNWIAKASDRFIQGHGGVTFTPPFMPNTYQYDISMPYVASAVYVGVYLQTNETITMHSTDPVTNVRSTTLLFLNSSLVGPFGIWCDRTVTFEINSPSDGGFTLRVSRNTADVVNLVATAMYPNSPLDDRLNPNTDYDLDPSFEPPTGGFLDDVIADSVMGTTYVFDVDYYLSSVQFTVSFIDSNKTIVTIYNNNTAAGAASALQHLNNAASTVAFAVTVGNNQFIMNSDVDGIYTINVVRRLPDLRNLTLVALNESMSVVDTNLTLWNYNAFSTVATPVGLIPGRFVAGTMLYSLYLPFSYASLQPRSFGWMASTTMTVDFRSPGATDYVSEIVLQDAISLMIPDAGVYNLSVGTQPNILRLNNTNDGSYLFLIYRGNGTMALFNVPDSIQSNFSTSFIDPNLPVTPLSGRGIGITLAGGLDLPSLQVRVSSDLGGQVFPSVLDFAAARGSLTSFFHFRAPWVTENSVVTLRFALEGADAWQIDPIQPLLIPIVPMNTSTIGSFTLIMSTFPSSVIINSVTSGITFVPSADMGRPELTNALELYIFPAAGVATPNKLTFTYFNWLSNQTFAFTAPTISANVSFRFELRALNGATNMNNAAQYSYPANFTGLVSVLATLTVDPVKFPAKLFNMQPSVIIPVTTQGIPLTNVTISISSSSANLLINSSMLQYSDAFMGTSQTFTMVPIFGALKTVTVVYVNFVIGGDDRYRYAPIAQMSFAVHPQGTLTIANAPTALYVGPQPVPRIMTVTPSEPLTLGGTLRLLFNGGSALQGTVSFDVLSLNIPASSNFRITTAPNVTQLMYLTFALTLDDAAHYIVPAPIPINILPLASIVIVSAPDSIYAGSTAVGITIKPDVILQADMLGGGFSVSVSSNVAGGTFSPSAGPFLFGIGTAATAVFSYTPPASYAQGTVTLSYTVTGTDSYAYKAITPSVITVLSQGGFSLAGMPAKGVVTGGTLSIMANPITTPPDGLSVSLEARVNTGSVLSASVLTFTSQLQQTFRFQAPSSTAIPMTITWVVSGPSAAAFAAPAPIEIMILARMVPSSVPTTLYVKQTSGDIAITPGSPWSGSPITLFPTLMSVSCAPSSSVCLFAPAQIRFNTPTVTTFKMTAPNTVPVGSYLTLSFALVDQAADYFAPPDPIQILVLEQNTINMLGNMVTYSYASTMLTLSPSAPVGAAVVVTFSVPALLGRVFPSSVTLPAGYTAARAALFPSVNITYEAPMTASPAQLVTVTAVVSGAGAAQFVAPSFVIDMRGSMILSVCGPSTSVYVTGVQTSADWNGIYEAAYSVNSKPHYQLVSTEFPGIVYHLFWFVDEAGTYPSSWMIDMSVSGAAAAHTLAVVNLDASAPFSNQWTQGLRFVGSPVVAITTMSVMCGVDCSALGTSTSLETQVCFGGTPLRSTPLPSIPTSCPLSCARYLPSVYASCKLTPYYLVSPSSIVSYGISTMLSRCASCTYSQVAPTLQACGITMTSSDVSQDLLSVLSMPSTCSPVCAPMFTSFFSSCVATQPVVPFALANFNALCAPPQAPLAVASIELVEAQSTALVLSWPTARQVQLVPLAVSYELLVLAYPYVGGVLVTDPPSWVSLWNGTENAFRVSTNLNVGTSYTFAVVASTAAGGAPMSPAATFSTLMRPIPAQVTPVVEAPVFEAAASAVLSPTYSANITWPDSASSLAVDDVIYRVRVVQALDALNTVWSPPLLVYNGPLLNRVQYSNFMPGLTYQVWISVAAWDAALERLDSNYGPDVASAQFTTPATVPNVPQFTSASSVSSSALTLNFANVPVCGMLSCAGVTYQIIFFNNGLSATAPSTLVVLPPASPPPATLGATLGQWTAITPALSYPSATPTSAPMSFVFNGVSAGCDYYFQIRAVNSQGPSAWSAPNLFVQTPATLPSVARAAVLSVSSSTSVLAAWASTASYMLDGGAPINSVHFLAVPSAGSSSSGSLHFYIAPAEATFTAASATPFTFSLTGLTPGVTYQIAWEVRNTVGWSGLALSPIVTLAMPPLAPRFESLVASDPTGLLTSFGNGAVLLATFDRPTNKPDLSSKALLDAMFAWGSTVPGSYAGAWSLDGRTLNIVFSATGVPTTNSFLPVGTFTARVIGSLKNAAGTSASLSAESNAIYTTKTLQGSWSAAPTRFIVPTAPVNVAANSVANKLVFALNAPSATVSYPATAVTLTLTSSTANGVLLHNGLAQPLSFAVPTTFAALLSNDTTVNPLLQIAFTPSIGFTGTVSITVRLDTTAGLVERHSKVVQVLPVNIAPVITVAGSLIFDPFVTTGVAMAGLTVSDINNAASTLMAVTFTSTSATAWFAYQSALPSTVTSATAMNAKVNRLTLSGSYAMLTPFLSTVVWFDPSVDQDSTSAVQANIFVDDLGSDIVDAPHLTVVATYNFVPQCTVTDVPTLVSVRFSDDLSALQVQFDGRLKIVLGSGVPQTQAMYNDCARYLSAATLALLGSSPSCYLSGSGMMTVQLGSGFTATVQSPFVLAGSTIRRCASSSAGASGSALILAPAQSLKPVLSVLGPTQLGACQDLLLSTTLVNVTGAVSYVWSVNAADVLTQPLAPTANSIVVSAAKLTAGVSYVFSVFVVNAVGTSSAIVTHTVIKSALPSPTLTPITPTTLSVRSSDAFSLATAASLSACIGSVLTSANTQLQFSWSAVATPTATVALDAGSRYQASLVVPAGSLVAGSSYVFTLLAVVSGDSTLRSTLSFSVTVAAASAAVVPSSSTQMVSSNSTITMPSSSLASNAVSTPSASANLLWTCQTASGLTCINLITQQTFAATQLPSGQSLTLQPGSLAAGSYLFTATTVVAGFGQGTVMARTWITVSPSSSVPVVSVRSSSMRVSVSDPLVLSSSVIGVDGVAVSAATASLYSFVWSMSPSSFSWTGLQDSTVVTGGLRSPFLQLNIQGRRNIFPGGALLRFRLTVTELATGAIGFAEVGVEVAAPPRGGSFVVAPTSGYAGSTNFAVSAVGWTGASALSYKFFTLNPMDGSLLGFGASPGSASDVDHIQFTGTIATNYSMPLLLQVSDLSGSTTMVRTNVTVWPNAAIAGLTPQAQTAANNAQKSQLQSLVSSGSVNRLMAYIAAESIAAQQSLLPASNHSVSFSGTASSSYAASYPRCYQSQLVSSSAWLPTGGVAVTSSAALIVRSTGLVAALVASVGSADTLTGLTACLTVANDPATATSLTSVQSLIAACMPVMNAAIAKSATLCTPTTVGCYAQEQALLNQTLATSASLIQAYLISSAAASASSTPLSSTNRRLLASSSPAALALTPLVASLSSVYDRVSRSLLQSVGQGFITNDCHISQYILRNLSSTAFRYGFNDGSSVHFPADWASTAWGASATLDTRVLYHAISPFPFHLTAPALGSIGSGVMFAARTDAQANVAATALSTGSATVTLRFIAQSSLAPFPQCLLWDGSSSMWGPTLGGGSVSTRFPSTVNTAAGFVDCIVNGVSDPIVAAFGSSSFVGSSTGGATGPVSSSSTGAGPTDPYGPLGAPPVVVNPLQPWGINATLVLSLNPASYLDAASTRTELQTKLMEDLVRVFNITADRFQINSMQAGSIVVNFYILPSADSGLLVPAAGWLRFMSQVGVAGSDLSTGQVTQYYSSLVAQNYMTTVQCADGIYRVVCPDLSSSAAASSSTGPDDTLRLNDGSTTSTSFLGGGNNLLIFIIAVSILGLLCLLVIGTICNFRRQRKQREEANSKLVSSANLSEIELVDSSGENTGRASSGAAANSATRPAKLKTGGDSSSSGSAADSPVHRPEGAPGSVEMAPIKTFTSTVQASPLLQGGEISDNDHLVIKRPAPAGAASSSSSPSSSPGSSTPPTAIVPSTGRPRLEKGNSPSTENTPENTPRGPRPAPLPSPSAPGRNPGSQPVRLHMGNPNQPGAPIRRNSFRMVVSGNASGGAARPARTGKLNSAMIAAASSMAAQQPGASPSNAAGAGASPWARSGPGGSPVRPSGAGAQIARPPSPGSTVLEIDDEEGM